jgi:RpiB/LacA/LacB family sugar-phosphate isomerase
MAEGLFRKLVEQQTDFHVASAGVSACDGMPASRHTKDILLERGINGHDHRSQLLTPELVEVATHLFCMSRSHLLAVISEFPEAEHKCYLVTEFAAEDRMRNRDIADPFGGSRNDYDQVRDTLDKVLPSVLGFINATAKSSTPTLPAMSTVVPSVQSIAIGSDHGGLELKDHLVKYLQNQGHKVMDVGTHGTASVDYPDFAGQVTGRVITADADAGILVCTTGIGMSIAANRHPGIQASLVHDVTTAKITREHNNSNVLVLAGATTSAELGQSIVDAWLQTPFAGGRHGRRVDKMNPSPEQKPTVQDILTAVDPAVAAVIVAEQQRQNNNIELIASENFTSKAVMAAQGSCLTNKYAEGYPAKRWYGGCEEVDKVEQIAIDRVCKLFGAKYANVQPHSGSQANAAVYFSVLQPGDKVLGMNLAHGGHLTHGNPANFSGRFYQFCQYGVSEKDGRIDYDELAEVAKREKPKMITAGASAYPRIIDFKRMGEIAKSVGAYLFVDMAHIAGLVAGGVHPSPMEHADFVTSTTHKSLRGPRGGIILTNNEELFKKFNSQVFPGVQGGPLMHVIAAKAVCFLEALKPEFAEYQRQVVKNAQAIAARLSELGYQIASGGTDNHLMLVDLRPKGLNGKTASETLDHAGITVNKNGIPFDTEKITLGGGIRIGTPAVTTRGMKEPEMRQIADWIHQALQNKDDAKVLANIRAEIAEVNKRFPLP